ncbi:unnamed protein product [Prunus armeniaca]|uniref:Uncharacterized protein n=1 Tax=Prunus armeniaca TaxID=36596 RepID=A0A6J5XPH6_PRUAR|nr:unnamed protein product [Prunus armeniaca]CAB4315766.1 unnamed protein product [Prunus armeniaca]
MAGGSLGWVVRDEFRWFRHEALHAGNSGESPTRLAVGEGGGGGGRFKNHDRCSSGRNQS